MEIMHSLLSYENKKKTYWNKLNPIHKIFNSLMLLKKYFLCPGKKNDFPNRVTLEKLEIINMERFGETCVYSICITCSVLNT